MPPDRFRAGKRLRSVAEERQLDRVREAARESNELERTGTRDALEGGPVAATRRKQG